MPRQSKWQAQHVGCQAAVAAVRAEHEAEIERLRAENERLRATLQSMTWKAEAMEREWEDGSISSDHMVFLLNGLIADLESARAALGA